VKNVQISRASIGAVMVLALLACSKAQETADDQADATNVAANEASDSAAIAQAGDAMAPSDPLNATEVRQAPPQGVPPSGTPNVYLCSNFGVSGQNTFKIARWEQNMNGGQGGWTYTFENSGEHGRCDPAKGEIQVLNPPPE
jgi:hypothetical protein